MRGGERRGRRASPGSVSLEKDGSKKKDDEEHHSNARLAGGALGKHDDGPICARFWQDVAPCASCAAITRRRLLYQPLARERDMSPRDVPAVVAPRAPRPTMHAHDTAVITHAHARAK